MADPVELGGAPVTDRPVTPDPGVPAAEELSAARVRRRTLALVEMQQPPEQVERVHDISVAAVKRQVPVRLFRPHAAGIPAPAIVLLHGGGWVGGDLVSHDRLARRVANATRSVVALVDYRRAPEHPYPAALDDAVDVTRWLLLHGDDLEVDPRRVVVMGDSAGGNLAAATCLRLRAEGAPPPLAQVLFYPLLVLPPRGGGPGLGGYPDVATVRWYWRQYLGTAQADEFSAPLSAASLADLPRALIYVGESDPVAGDSRDYAARLRAAGVPTTLRAYPAGHAFMVRDAVEPSAEVALRDLSEDVASGPGQAPLG